MKRTYQYHDLNTGRMADAAEALEANMALTYLASATATAMLAAITTTGLFMAIYAAAPGITGTGELAAATAYTAVSGGRPPVTWGSVTAGVVPSTDTQTFAMLVTEASGILGWGLWSANTGGTFLGGGLTSGLSGSIPSGANVVFTNALTLTVAG
jgi:hypothetical protein